MAEHRRPLKPYQHPPALLRPMARDLRETQHGIISTLRGVSGVGVGVHGRGVILHGPGRRPRSPRAAVASFRVDNAEDDYLICRPWNPVNASAGGTDVYVAKPYILRRTPFDEVTTVYADGQNITYTYTAERRRLADDGTDSEYQVMTPDYIRDDSNPGYGEIILAVSGVTDITVDSDYDSWAAQTAYAKGDFIRESGGLVFRCSTAGTSGGSEPEWPTDEGGTVTDGEVVWTNSAAHKYVVWTDLNTAGRMWAREM